jgi:hypothetical protein
MLREHTEKLAKLMAGEDIDVIQKNAPTAYFDLKYRRLIIPNWKNLSVVEEEMLVGHEIGHALYTPLDTWTTELDAFDGSKKVFQNVMNVVEDARIERKVKTKYPGMRHIFYFGYEELFKRGIFCVDDETALLGNLIEQINWNYKIPGKIDFTKHQMFDHFVAKIDAIVTFEDVVALSKEVYQYCKEEHENKKSPGKDNQESEGEDNQESEGEDNQESEGKDNQESEGKDNQESEGKDNQESEGKDDSSSDSDSFENKYGNNKLEQAKEEFLKKNQDQIRSAQTKYIPEIDLKKIVISYKTVLDSFFHMKGISKPPISVEDDEDDVEPIDFNISTSRTSFNKTRKYTIDYYSKIFEMKKKASEYKKTLNFRSGKLDMNKLTNYKFDDKIFMTGQIKFKGKNHGLVVFLDMSGSMSQILKSCLVQVLELVSFCRNSGIPVSVYGFSDINFTGNCRDSNHRWYGYKVDVAPEHQVNMPHAFHLIEYFSPQMSIKEYNTMFDTIVSGEYRNSSYFQLSGTALAAACLCLEAVVNKMKMENGSEVVNAIFLTDGGDSNGGDLHTYHGSVFDPKTKMKVSFDTINKTLTNHSVFSSYETNTVPMAILELMKKRVHYVNVVNFYIHNMRSKKSRHGRKYTDTAAPFAVVDTVKLMGYDETYFIDPACFQVKKDDNKMKSATTIEDINTSYMYSNKITKEKQTIVRSFIDKIC